MSTIAIEGEMNECILNISIYLTKKIIISYVKKKLKYEQTHFKLLRGIHGRVYEYSHC